MKTIKLGIVGLGTVGTGVVRIIQNNQQKILATSSCQLQIKTIVVANLAKQRHIDLEGIKLTNQIADIVADDEIQIVIEVMGTIDPAKSYIEALLDSGKNVVTANKDLLATYGNELITHAQENHVNLLYEASVAGGIPILRTIATSFAADQITSVAGIINGTSNYILTQMSENELTYNEALQQAQELGLAETDPTNDVSGKDAGYKMAILTQFAFGVTVPLENIFVAGITQITKADILRAQKWGYVIKLIGQARSVDDKLSVSVEPMFVRKDHPLATIKNENNAVLVTGSSVGEVMFYGAGAGELPTANSVLNDVLATVKDLQLQQTGTKFNNFSRTNDLLVAQQQKNHYFLTLVPKDDSRVTITSNHHKHQQTLSKQKNDLATELSYQTKPISVQQFRTMVAKLKGTEKLTITAAYPLLD